MPDASAGSDPLHLGAVSTHTQTAEFDPPLQLALGGVLPAVTCGYETWGTLDPDAGNAVLVCHALSGDAHAARHDGADEPGWWDALIGPGKAIDTDRFFVVCSNVLGGCRGSTGPGSTDPATGRPWGAGFPAITIADMVTLQKRLMDRLGIARWRAVVGGSLGGHQALAWATTHPRCVEHCVALATSPRLTSQALAFDVIGRNAIQTDPQFHGGQYYDHPKGAQPDTGLAIARMLGHITYLSSEGMDKKFDVDRNAPRDVVTGFEKRFSVGSYLAHQGDKFTQRFDANSYVAITLAMDRFDLGRDRAALADALHAARGDGAQGAESGVKSFVVVSFSSDWLFPPQQSRDLVNALAHLDHPVTYAEITSPGGHDAFLLEDEIAQYGPLIAAKLGRVTRDAPRLRPTDAPVLELIRPGESVLDLGCGSGRLLAELRRRGHTRLVGVEVAQPKIIAAAARGLDVIDYDLNRGLPAFADGQFDTVVLSATLQSVDELVHLFDEMLRVGRRVVIGFANFAHKTLRDDYAKNGRSPRSEGAGGAYDHPWHSTPNRRFPSIVDVLSLIDERGAALHEAVYLDSASGQRIDAADDPNLNADMAVVVVSR